MLNNVNNVDSANKLLAGCAPVMLSRNTTWKRSRRVRWMIGMREVLKVASEKKGLIGDHGFGRMRSKAVRVVSRPIQAQGLILSDRLGKCRSKVLKSFSARCVRPEREK